jgi:hypothetical protein
VIRAMARSYVRPRFPKLESEGAAFSQKSGNRRMINPVLPYFTIDRLKRLEGLGRAFRTFDEAYGVAPGAWSRIGKRSRRSDGLRPR